MVKTHIYDFTPEELEEIRRADEEIERRYRAKKRRNIYNCGDDRQHTDILMKQHNNHIGNPLWEYRVKHNITQRQLAKQLYITQTRISAMERGKQQISSYVMDWLRERGEAV